MKSSSSYFFERRDKKLHNVLYVEKKKGHEFGLDEKFQSDSWNAIIVRKMCNERRIWGIIQRHFNETDYGALVGYLPNKLRKRQSMNSSSIWKKILRGIQLVVLHSRGENLWRWRNSASSSPEALRKWCRWIGTLWSLQEIESKCREAECVEPWTSLWITSMSKNPIKSVETIVRDGRGFNKTLDAHSFELVHQKTGWSTDDFSIIPRKSQMSKSCWDGGNVHRGHTIISFTQRGWMPTRHASYPIVALLIAVREEPKLHVVFHQRDVTDWRRSPWKL